MQNSGHIFIISAASGTGKTTLVSRLVNNNSNIQVSISHTTREPRPQEENGVHYHFITAKTFQQMAADGGFIEYAKVYDHFYGTSFKSLDDLTSRGIDVILEIDTQGASQVRKLLPDAHSIFILPPSFEVLANRLTKRGTDNETAIAKRLTQAKNEIEEAYLFDYIVVNESLDIAEEDITHIIKSFRLTEAEQRQKIVSVLSDI